MLRMLTFLLVANVHWSVAHAQLLPYFNVDEDGLWLDGYDPVAYFVDGKATEGQARFAFTYEGARFHFASQTHLDLFRRSPQRYLPQYGGYCAYAMGASNEKIEVDPETFKLKDGKLFLFYNAFFNNTLTTWNKDEPRLHAAADVNWKKFVHKK